MDESQNILEPRAKEILKDYNWNRFKTFQDVEKDFPYHSLVHFQEFEDNYKRFINFLVRESERAWAPKVLGGHLNFIKDLAFYRRCINKKEYNKKDRIIFFYDNLGENLLDKLVSLLKIDDEALRLLPKYYSEEFANITNLKRRYLERCKKEEREMLMRQKLPEEYINSHLKTYQPIHIDDVVFVMGSRIYQLDNEIGQKNLEKLLKQKIPHFPQEVHEQRLQQLNDSLIILDKLYNTSLEYVKEKGLK